MTWSTSTPIYTSIHKDGEDLYASNFNCLSKHLFTAVPYDYEWNLNLKCVYIRAL